MSIATNIAICMEKRFCDVTVNSLMRKRPDLQCHTIDYNTLEASSEAKSCKVLFTYSTLLVKLIPQMPDLEWVQLTWAGVESIFKPDNGIRRPTCRITRMANYGPLLAEYVIGQIISWERRFLDIAKLQEKQMWEKAGYSEYRPLSELVVSILGVGEIGKETGKICKQLGMTVHGLMGRKGISHLQNFDVLRPFDELPTLLSESDYIINILPSTPDTRGMLGNKMLQNCKVKKGKFINIGRGDIVSENELIEALDNNYLSGVTLDVFEKEPLPASSKLWSHPKVVITPHVAGVYLPHLGVDFFLDNLSRYHSGKALLAEVDWKLGY